MIQSMTGYGRSEQPLSHGRSVIAEIKTLNGKQLDLNIKISTVLKPFEGQVRKMLQQKLYRGSVEIGLFVQHNGAGRPMQINKELAAQYYKDIAELQAQLGLQQEKVLPALLAMPDVVGSSSEPLDEAAFAEILPILQQTVEQVLGFRKQEGAVLEAELLQRITNIETLAQHVVVPADERVNKIRERIEGVLAQTVGADQIDQNRLEQELVYYVEKLDIAEEQLRLAAHCKYFKELLAGANEEGVGKKLGFVLQEVGREINTMGSKASDAAIQQFVVQMKDELEKAKEQVLNVL